MSDPHESPILIEAINKSATTLEAFLDQHNEIIESIDSVDRELAHRITMIQSTIKTFPDSPNLKEYESRRDAFIEALLLVRTIRE